MPDARFGAAGSVLPGDRNATPQPSWEVELTNGLLPYLRDHVVQGAVVLPGAAYVDAALSAQWKTSNGSASVLEEVKFHRALVVGEHEKPSLRVEIDERSRAMSMYGRPAGKGTDWTLHTTAKLSGRRPARHQRRPGGPRERCREAIAPKTSMHVARQRAAARSHVPRHLPLASGARRLPRSGCIRR